jgi:hypothetical protein
VSQYDPGPIPDLGHFALNQKPAQIAEEIVLGALTPGTSAGRARAPLQVDSDAQ